MRLESLVVMYGLCTLCACGGDASGSGSADAAGGSGAAGAGGGGSGSGGAGATAGAAATGGASGSGAASGSGGAGATSGASGSGGAGGSSGAGATGGAGGSGGESGSGGGGAAAATGNPCTSFADCGDGYDCNTEAPGGYCLPGAPGGPDSCSLPDYPCPEGTTCSPLPWHAISGVCMKTCSKPEDCRAGYVCGYVELFPGDPTSPMSPDRVCWTVCQPGTDQSCNDDIGSSSLHGTCLPDGTCSCNPGSSKNPDTGRCS